MKWTDKPPKKPGWYWVRYYEGDIEVANVYPCMDDNSIWCCQHAKGNERGRFYVGSIDKISNETNVALYARALVLIEEN